MNENSIQRKIVRSINIEFFSVDICTDMELARQA